MLDKPAKEETAEILGFIHDPNGMEETIMVCVVARVTILEDGSIKQETFKIPEVYNSTCEEVKETKLLEDKG